VRYGSITDSGIQLPTLHAAKGADIQAAGNRLCSRSGPAVPSHPTFFYKVAHSSAV